MKVIYNYIIPFGSYRAINLFGVIFAKSEFNPISQRTINHESIHTIQMKEALYIFFYLWYVLEWLVRLIQYRDSKQAYRNISFEREAYVNEENETYIKSRTAFSWLDYILN